MKALPAYAKFALLAIGLALVILAMVVAKDLLMPLGWAILFALLILPVQKRLERGLHHRGIAAIVSILILMVIIGSVVYLLSSQVVNLINDLPGILKKFSSHLADLRMFIEEELGIPYQDQRSQLQSRLGAFFEDRAHSIGEALSNTIKTIVFIGILPIYIFFILYYRSRIDQFLKMLYGEGNYSAVTLTITKASNVVQKYLSGMAIVTAIVAVLVLIIFLIMGIKHALFFAVFVAVLNLIPYVGVILASLVSILYVFITKDSLIYPVLTFALLWGIQLLENNLITPYIVGKQVQLNPLAVILVIILGGMIWGVSGMILFIPMLGGLKVVLDETPGLRPYGFLLGDDPPDQVS